MSEQKVGKVTHYFGKISVAIVNLTDTLRAGDTIKIKGSHTDFEQVVDSMQIEHQNIEEASAGDNIGLKVKNKVRVGDIVYKVEVE